MKPKDTLILTRRIQLLINSKNKDEIGNTYKQLYSWQRACQKAANTITAHLFVQDRLPEMIYLTDGTKAKLADRRKDEEGILTTSPMNTTYQVLSKEWKGEIPMHIMSSLNMWVTKQYRADRAACLRGGQALRSYKNTLPVPFMSTDIKQLQLSEDGMGYVFQLFGLPFRTFFGRDGGEKKALVEKAIKGEVKWCTSSLQLKDNKIFMLAAFEFPPDTVPAGLDESIIAEASLSVDFPVRVTIGSHRYTIGSREEFLYRRLAIQKGRERVQAAVAFHRGGHGRKRKCKALNRFEEAEKNYVETRLHTYSRRLINLCIQHRVGALLLTNQQEKEDIAKEDAFLLRNWSYYGLKQKIAYKAGKAGILLIKE